MTSTSWAPPLNDQLGLDPGLTGLAKLWSDRKLAIVRGVGYPRPDRSHPRCRMPLTARRPGWWSPRTSARQRCEQTFGSLTSSDGAGAPGGSGGNGNRASLAAQLGLVAWCTTANVPTRVYPVSASGFDLHANEKDAQTGRLTGFDKAVTAFRTVLAGSARERDVVLMAYSEFGRRVRANASEGTDPGTAGPVLLIGDSVTAGFHGDEPSRTDLGDGDLMTSTDFRAVYGEVLDRML